MPHRAPVWPVLPGDDVNVDVEVKADSELNYGPNARDKHVAGEWGSSSSSQSAWNEKCQVRISIPVRCVTNVVANPWEASVCLYICVRVYETGTEYIKSIM